MMAKNDLYLLGLSRKIKLTRSCALADAMDAQDLWPEDAPAILYADLDKPAEAVKDVIKHYTNVIMGDKDATDKVRLVGETYTRGQLCDRIAEYIGADPIPPKGRIVSGDHRTLALMLLAAIGRGVSYRVPVRKAKDPATVGLASNVRHALAQGLSDAEIIPQVNDLIRAGVVNAASDLCKLGFRHGKAQYVYNQAELVRLHGVRLEDAVKVTGANSTKAKNADDPKAFVRDLLSGKAEQAAKALSGKVMDELLKVAKTDDARKRAALVAAIRNGKRSPVETWIVSGQLPETPAETPDTEE